jgi:hypothetical protein
LVFAQKSYFSFLGLTLSYKNCSFIVVVVVNELIVTRTFLGILCTPLFYILDLNPLTPKYPNIPMTIGYKYLPKGDPITLAPIIQGNNTVTIKLSL